MAEITFHVQGTGPDDEFVVTVNHDFSGRVTLNYDGNLIKFTRQEFKNFFHNVEKAFEVIKDLEF